MSEKVNCDAYDGCSFEGGDEDIICSRVDALRAKLDRVVNYFKYFVTEVRQHFPELENTKLLVGADNILAELEVRDERNHR